MTTESIFNENPKDLLFLCGYNYLKKVSPPDYTTSLQTILDEETDFTLKIGQIFFDLIGKIDMENLSTKLKIPKDFLYNLLKQYHVSGICNICCEYKTRLHDHLRLRHGFSKNLIADYTNSFGDSCYFFMYVEKKVTEASKIIKTKLERSKKSAKMDKNNSNTDEKINIFEKKEKTYGVATEFSLVCTNCNEKINHFCGSCFNFYKSKGSDAQPINQKKKKVIGKVLN